MAKKKGSKMYGKTRGKKAVFLSRVSESVGGKKKKSAKKKSSYGSRKSKPVKTAAQKAASPARLAAIAKAEAAENLKKRRAARQKRLEG